MSEIVFIIEQSDEGGWCAKAVEDNIFTQADNLDKLKENIREAVLCHFEGQDNMPSHTKLHFIKEKN